MIIVEIYLRMFMLEISHNNLFFGNILVEGELEFLL